MQVFSTHCSVMHHVATHERALCSSLSRVSTCHSTKSLLSPSLSCWHSRSCSLRILPSPLALSCSCSCSRSCPRSCSRCRSCCRSVSRSCPRSHSCTLVKSYPVLCLCPCLCPALILALALALSMSRARFYTLLLSRPLAVCSFALSLYSPSCYLAGSLAHSNPTLTLN